MHARLHELLECVLRQRRFELWRKIVAEYNLTEKMDAYIRERISRNETIC